MMDIMRLLTTVPILAGGGKNKQLCTVWHIQQPYDVHHLDLQTKK